MKLLQDRFVRAFSFSALICFVLPTLTWSREYALQWAEGMVPFGLLFLIISTVMRRKTSAVNLDSEQCSDIGTLFL